MIIISDKDAKTIKWEKDNLFSNMQKNEDRPLPQSIYKKKNSK